MTIPESRRGWCPREMQFEMFTENDDGAAECDSCGHMLSKRRVEPGVLAHKCMITGISALRNQGNRGYDG